MAIIVALSQKANIELLIAQKGRIRAFLRSQSISTLKSRADLSQKPLKTFWEGRGVKKIVTLWIINAIAVTVLPGIVLELVNLPGVESITLDQTVQAPPMTLRGNGLPKWDIRLLRFGI